MESFFEEYHIDILTPWAPGGAKKKTDILIIFISGGLIDDLIVTNAGDHLYVVSNAGCRHKDIPLMAARAEGMRAEGRDVTLELIEDRGLVALQGEVMIGLS